MMTPQQQQQMMQAMQGQMAPAPLAPPPGKPPQRFDHVVLATHPDTSLKLLGASASAEEGAALRAVRYQPNAIYVHTDARLMPRERAAWA